MSDIQYWISYNDRPYKVRAEQYEDLRISCAGRDSSVINWRGLTPGTKTPIRGWVEPQPNIQRLQEHNKVAQ